MDKPDTKEPCRRRWTATVTLIVFSSIDAGLQTMSPAAASTAVSVRDRPDAFEESMSSSWIDDVEVKIRIG